MKTIKTEIVDGVEIITGFSQLSVDPVETQNQNLQAIIDLPESEALREKAAQKMEHLRAATAAKQQAQNHLFLKTVAENENNTAEVLNQARLYAEQDLIYRTRGPAAAVCNTELIEISKTVDEKAKEVLRNNPVYNGTRANEYVKTDAEIENIATLLQAKTKNQQLKLSDLSYIDDYRTKYYHIKNVDTWEEIKITTLGTVKPTEGIFPEDLTDVQRAEIDHQLKLERIAALTAEEKTAAYNGEVENLAMMAAVMRSKLEIQGATDALEQAQTYYNTELLVINADYGI